jgi:hypothetical protein
MTRRPAVIVLILCAALASSGCESNGASSDGNSAEVSATDLGSEWPLTVDHGTLRCDGSGGLGAVTFEAPDGSTYGVNGIALGQGAPDIRPIWADDPSLGQGLKINIGPLLDKGLSLC